MQTLCAAVVALHSAAFAGGEGWTSDFEAARKQAEELKKDLLVDFTGSDWCGWCIKLNDEVFKKDPFKEGVKDTFVLVEVDSPRDKAKLSDETQKQNEELIKKYAVQGYPTILLCDAGGRPYAATGYQAGGPEKYVDHLNELRARKVARNEAFEKAASTEGVEKAKLLVAGLGGMELEDELVTAFYGDVVEQIKAADPQDETGYLKQGAAKEKFRKFQDELMAFGRKKDHDGALGHIDTGIKDGGFDKDTTQQLMVTRAMILLQQKKFDDALKAIDDAKAFDPESQMGQGLDKFKERIQQMKDGEGAGGAE